MKVTRVKQLEHLHTVLRNEFLRVIFAILKRFANE